MDAVNLAEQPDTRNAGEHLHSSPSIVNPHPDSLVPYGSSPPQSPLLNVPIGSISTTTSADLPSCSQLLPRGLSTPNLVDLPSAEASRALLSRSISVGTAGTNTLGLPNLTTVTLAEMKSMRAIWYRTRDSLRSGLEELVSLGLISKSPQLSKSQHQNLALVTAFCSRLDRIIHVSEADGISDATVEVIDMTRVDEDETPSSFSNDRDPTGKNEAVTEKSVESPERVGNRLRKSIQNSTVVARQSLFEEVDPTNENPELVQSCKRNSTQGSRLTASHAGPRQIDQPTTNRAEESKSKKKKPRPKVTQTAPGKRKRKGVKDMTQEEQKAHQQRAELRKKQREASTYIEVPQIGTFMEQVWSPSRCEQMQALHEQMRSDSRNPKWDLGPQLMNLVQDMVEWFIPDTHPSSFYEFPDLFSPSVESISAFADIYDPNAFKAALSSSPRLLQVDAADPFFQSNVVRLDLIEKAYESNDPIKAASWKTLYSMMIRTDEDPDYTQDNLVQPILGSAICKLYSLSVSCLEHFHHYLKPGSLTLGNHSTQKNESLQLAGHYIIGKIRALKDGAMAPQGTVSVKKGNGLMILQKRIWDTLLCCLMMQQSKFGLDLERRNESNSEADGSGRKSVYYAGRNLFRDGDVQNTESQAEMKEWGKIRLAAFGSMAIFLLYGTAGWWHCLTDSHNFNQKDVWALVQLAHAKNEWLYGKGHVNNKPAEDTPWYTTDSFVRWLLIKGGMHTRDVDKVDWEYAPRFWAKQVTEINIARFALQDILSEVCRRDYKSLNYKGQVSPGIKFDKRTQSIVTKLKQNIRTGLKMTLDSHHASISTYEEALKDDRLTGSSPREAHEKETNGSTRGQQRQTDQSSETDPQDETSSLDIPLAQLHKRSTPSTDLHPASPQTSRRRINHDTTNHSSSPLSSPLPDHLV